MGHSLYNSWLVGWILQKLNREIIKDGLVMAMNRLIIKKMIGIQVVNRKKVITRLREEPTIVISNHPSQAEVLIILGLMEKREDLFLIADQSFLHLLPAADNNIIPVYIHHQLINKNRTDWKMSLLKAIHQSPVFPKEEAHQKNIESIETAITKINQGGLVIIFPINQESGGIFMPGVGHLIKGLKKPTKVNIVAIRVSGTSTWDYLRLIPGLKWLLPKVRVVFGKVAKASDFGNGDSKAIAKNLETFYYHSAFDQKNTKRGVAAGAS